MPDDECEVVLTHAGARAMRDRVTGELMHAGHAPRDEADALYVGPSRLTARLARPHDDALRVLDVGLGAGSNAIAAWRVVRAMESPARRLEIVSFDRSLSALRIALRDENRADFDFDGAAGTAARAVCDTGSYTDARVAWSFVPGELPDTLSQVHQASADLVFWDPFSPRANPHLWTVKAFTVLRRLCRAGATVHTYSGATATRSALLLAGFAVGVGHRTDNARETTVAAVDAADLVHPLDARWLQRVARSSAPFPTDAPPDALDRLAACPQFGR